LQLQQRTADALSRRDPGLATSMQTESEALSLKAAALEVSPTAQEEMLQAIDGWTEHLGATIQSLVRQIYALKELDAIAADMDASARALKDSFILDAEGFGRSLQSLLVFGTSIALLAGACIAIVVARSIVLPLGQLQRSMTGLAANLDAASLPGLERGDELGDMARATLFFVHQIAQRESAIRLERDRADAALIELRRTQDELIRAEKLASLGQLVAGVAHEINTPLGLALTTATVLRDEARNFQSVSASGSLSRTQLAHFIGRVGDGTAILCTNLFRAADLVHGFKQVAVDRINDDSRAITLDIWLEELLTSLQPLLKKGGHRLRQVCPPDIVVEVNPGVLAQIITNLVTNAIMHGFGAMKHGEIVVRVKPASEALHLDIADNGCGISPENLARVFDPFFTTARNRGSTGLGMHIVYNLVTFKLNGRIEIESEVNKGTNISIRFPLGRPRAALPAPSAEL
jgi:signal transduction histidine kinase